MNKHFLIAIWFLAFGAGGVLEAQERGGDLDRPDLITEAPEELLTPVGPKKPRKAFYMGYRTRRKVIRRPFGKGRRVLEIFRVLPKRVTASLQLSPYVPHVYWYDRSKRKVVQGRRERFDPKRYLLLHGAYVQKIRELVTAERFFYLGGRHGRWANWNLGHILQDKAHYYKGWRKDANIRYYDPENRLVRDVTPMEYGEKEGEYFAFHRTGGIAARGRYMSGCKIGTWIEFYPSGTPKRELKYPEVPCKNNPKPYVSREWTLNRQLRYEYKP